VVKQSFYQSAAFLYVKFLVCRGGTAIPIFTAPMLHAEAFGGAAKLEHAAGRRGGIGGCSLLASGVHRTEPGLDRSAAVAPTAMATWKQL
jgi:hypothetical protein